MHLFAGGAIFFSQTRVAGKQSYVAQRKYLWIDIAMAGDSPLLAQHPLSIGRQDKANEQFARVWMRRALGQGDGMNIGNYRFVKNILHRATLAFDARSDVRVGIGYRVKFT